MRLREYKIRIHPVYGMTPQCSGGERHKPMMVPMLYPATDYCWPKLFRCAATKLQFLRPYIVFFSTANDWETKASRRREVRTKIPLSGYMACSPISIPA